MAKIEFQRFHRFDSLAPSCDTLKQFNQFYTDGIYLLNNINGSNKNISLEGVWSLRTLHGAKIQKT